MMGRGYFMAKVSPKMGGGGRGNAAGHSAGDFQAAGVRTDDVLEVMAGMRELSWVKDLIGARDDLRSSHDAWRDSVLAYDPDPVLVATTRGALRGSVSVGNVKPEGFTKFFVGALRDRGVPDDWIWMELAGMPFGTLRALEAVRNSGCANMFTEGSRVLDAVRLIGDNDLTSGAEIADWLSKNGLGGGIGTNGVLGALAQVWRMREGQVARALVRVPPEGLARQDPGINALLAAGASYPEAVMSIREAIGDDGLMGFDPSARVDVAIDWMRAAVDSKGIPSTISGFQAILNSVHRADPFIFPEVLKILEGARVREDLNLSVIGTGMTKVPDGLNLDGDFILSGLDITEIGDRVSIGGKLVAVGCERLERIGKDMSVMKTADFGGCRNLLKVENGFKCYGGVNMGGCERLESLPDDFGAVSLWLEGAVFFERLPERLTLLQDLCMERCPSWDGEIPEGATIGRFVYTDDHPCVFANDGRPMGGVKASVLRRPE
jgi:hypothetical protein